MSVAEPTFYEEWNELRLNGRLEVACEPNSGERTISELMDHLVPLVIDIPKMYWMIPSRSILMWILRAHAAETELQHRDSRVV